VYAAAKQTAICRLSEIPLYTVPNRPRPGKLSLKLRVPRV
jgi:hypothetical protein